MLPRGIAFLFLIGARPLWALPCDSGVVFSGPISITNGGTYSGNWQSTDPSVPAISITTTQPVTIVGSNIRGPGDLILAPAASSPGINVTVRDSCFVGTNPNVAGKAKGTPIHIYNAASVLVEHCDFESGGFYGIWVQQYVGDNTPNNTIRIRYNRIHDVDGRFSDGNGGYLMTEAGAFAHAIILSDVHGVPGIEIAWNQIVNEPYQSRVEDSISIYNSSGTPASPLQIHDNYIQGGYAADPASADRLAYNGSAFTTDGSSQTDPAMATSWLKIHDNQAVNTGSAGIGIALGHDNELYSNRVVSSGQLADGTNISTSYAAGIIHFNYLNDPPGVFGSNSVHDNLSGMRRWRNDSWERFDYYFGTPPAVSFNNRSWSPTTAASPTPADEAGELQIWLTKLTANGIHVGRCPCPPRRPRLLAPTVPFRSE